jgi:hypothetical protein
MLTKQNIVSKELYKDLKELESRAKVLRQEYCKIINNYIEDLLYTKKDDLSNPNWAYYRAFKDGQIDGLKKVLTLIEGGLDD